AGEGVIAIAADELVVSVTARDHELGHRAAGDHDVVAGFCVDGERLDFGGGETFHVAVDVHVILSTSGRAGDGGDGDVIVAVGSVDDEVAVFWQGPCYAE